MTVLAPIVGAVGLTTGSANSRIVSVPAYLVKAAQARFYGYRVLFPVTGRPSDI